MLDYSEESVNLAYQMLIEGEKKTTKWEGIERISIYLNDPDDLVSLSSIKIIRHIVQGISQQEANEKRKLYLENVINTSSKYGLKK